MEEDLEVLGDEDGSREFVSFGPGFEKAAGRRGQFQVVGFRVGDGDVFRVVDGIEEDEQQLVRRLLFHGGPDQEVRPVLGLDMGEGCLGPFGNDLFDRQRPHPGQGRRVAGHPGVDRDFKERRFGEVLREKLPHPVQAAGVEGLDVRCQAGGGRRNLRGRVLGSQTGGASEDDGGERDQP